MPPLPAKPLYTEKHLVTGSDIYAEEWETEVPTWHFEDCVITKTGEKMQRFLHQPSETQTRE